jgi:hypothetical protein
LSRRITERPDRSLGDAKSVTPRPTPDWLDIIRSVDLGEEARERVFSASAISRGAQNCIPVAVMDGLARSYFSSEHGDGDLLESLPTEFAIEILDLQLGRQPKYALELLERMFITSGLCVEVLRKAAESVCALTRFKHTILEAQVLVFQRHLGRRGEFRFRVHGPKRTQGGGRLRRSPSSATH